MSDGGNTEAACGRLGGRGVTTRLDARFLALSRLRTAAVDALRAHYRQDGLLEVRAPILVDVTGACENVSTVFQVGTGRMLAQTGQLALERALVFQDGVWCHTGSFRHESPDERHLAEFELIEEEIAWRHPSAQALGDPLTALLRRITSAIQAVLRVLSEDCGEELRGLGGDPEQLARLVAAPFRQITYSDALDLLSGLRATDRVGWGTDLSSEHEATLLRLVYEDEPPAPLFVTHFPEEIKFFNMSTDRTNPRVVLSADLLLPGAGEAVGAAVRETDFAVLTERFRRLMRPRIEAEVGLEALRGFDEYFCLIEQGAIPPHGGYGIGLERVIQFVVGERDIRRISLPYLFGEPHDS